MNGTTPQTPPWCLCFLSLTEHSRGDGEVQPEHGQNGQPDGREQRAHLPTQRRVQRAAVYHVAAVLDLFEENTASGEELGWGGKRVSEELRFLLW